MHAVLNKCFRSNLLSSLLAAALLQLRNEILALSAEAQWFRYTSVFLEEEMVEDAVWPRRGTLDLNSARSLFAFPRLEWLTRDLASPLLSLPFGQVTQSCLTR